MTPKLSQLLSAQAEGKALGFNPAFEDPGSPVGVWDLNNYKGTSPTKGMSGGPRVKQGSAKRHTEAYGGMQAMDWIMDCTRYCAETVANAEYHFEKPEGPTAQRIPGDAVAPPQTLYDLLRKPNPHQDYIEFMELLVIDLLLTGNSYIFKFRTNEKGQPLAMYRLAPPYVEIETGKFGPNKYIYQIPNADKIECDVENVIHFKLPNPEADNPYYGLGIISGAGRAADLEIALTDTIASYYENHAMPSMVLETLRRVPRDVFKKVRAQLRARAQGSKNAGELLTLEMGLKLASVNPTAMDAAYLEMAKFSRDRIFSWFRMNPKMVGIDDNGNVPLPQAQRQFDNKTARPLMNKIQEKLSMELTLAWDLEYKLDYEYQMAPEEQAKVGQVFAQLPGIMVDELRKVSGLGPHPEKDIGSMTLNLPGEEGGTGQPGETPSEHGFPDRSLAGEAGRPPKPSHTKAFPRGGKPLPKGSAARKPQGKAIEDILDEIDALEGKALDEPGSPPEDVLKPKRDKEVDDAAQFIHKELGFAAGSLNHDLQNEVEEDGKAMTNKVRSAEAWKPFVEKMHEIYEQGIEKVTSAAVIHHSEQGVVAEDEVDYQALKTGIAKSAKFGVNGVVKTFKDQIAKAVKEARANESPVAAAVDVAVKDWLENKAPQIAQTTATVGYNEATIENGKGAGFTHFLVSDGSDNDEACAEANGEIWPAAKCQEQLLEHPNCRRGFIPTTP